MTGLKLRPFEAAGNHVTVSLTVTARVIGVVRFDGGLGLANARSVRIFNAGPDTAFIEFVGEQGDQTALRADGIPIAAGAREIFAANAATFLAAIAQSTTATLYATPGEGGL